MIVLSKELVMMLHQEFIEETGGSHGVKDESLLESALSAPFQSYQHQDLYPSVYQKAARLGFGLTRNPR